MRAENTTHSTPTALGPTSNLLLLASLLAKFRVAESQGGHQHLFSEMSLEEKVDVLHNAVAVVRSQRPEVTAAAIQAAQDRAFEQAVTTGLCRSEGDGGRLFLVVSEAILAYRLSIDGTFDGVDANSLTALLKQTGGVQ